MTSKKLVLTFALAISFSFLFGQTPGSFNTLDFNGATHVAIGEILPASYTKEAWIRINPLTNNQNIVSGDAGNAFWVVYNGGTGERLLSAGHTNPTFVDVQDTATLEADRWYHVAVTYDGSDLTLYKNGVVVATQNSVAAHGDPTTFIGAFNATVLRLSGNIDEVRIWSVALSESDIRDWMCRKVTASHPQYANMTAYYNFDETSGTTLPDQRNSNDGTIVGTGTWTTSGAPIGDNSAHDYVGTIEPSITDVDGATFSANTFTAATQGAHVFVVNEAPNVTAIPSSFSSLETSRYFGVFIADDTIQAYTVSYDYANNTNINGVGGEADARFTSRDDNSGAAWIRASNESDIDITGNTLSKCNQLDDQQEYLVGFEATNPVTGVGSGNTFDFDGSSFVSIGEIIPASYTKEAWIKIDAVAASNNIISGDATSGHVFWASSINSFRLAAGHNSAGTNFTDVQDTDPLEFDTWYHVAVTYDSSTNTLRLYKNGVEVAVNSTVIEHNDPTGFIGAFNSNFEFDGNIDDIRIWNTALSETNLRDWMCQKLTSSHPNYCNLVAHYRMDESSGTVRDWNAGNDGTVTGTTTYVASGAAIGDQSAHDYVGTIEPSISHVDGSTFSVDQFVSPAVPLGAHVYIINEAPTVTTAPNNFNPTLETTRYFGAFAVDGDEASYSVNYDYTNNTNINGLGTENQARFVIRDDNADGTWARGSNETDVNTTTNIITKCNQSGQGEYIAGFETTSVTIGAGAGNTIEFDGAADFASAGELLSQSYTKEAWIRIDPASTTGNIISGDDGGAGHALFVNRTGANFFLRSGHAPNFNDDAFDNTNALEADRWYHVAVTYDAGTGYMILYKNGIQVASATSVAAHSDPSVFVGSFGGTVNYLRGNVDDVRIWNTVLTVDEIRDAMCKQVDNTHPQFCNLVAYYRMDEGTTTALRDWVAGGDGTFGGAPSVVSSGAAIGDNSVADYTGTVAPSIADTDGATFTANTFSGSPTGAHVYVVNQAPNNTTPPTEFASLETSRYFGVFTADGTSPTYTISYDYTNNTNIEGVGAEATASFAKRDDGQNNTWVRNTNEDDININTNIISRCTRSGDDEFIVGFQNNGPTEGIGSGNRIDFDASNGDYFEAPSILPQSYTKEAWVLIASGSGQNNFISGSNGANGHAFFAPITESYQLSSGHNGSFTAVQDADPLDLDTWYHVAVTYDATTQDMFLYKNGQEVASNLSVANHNDATIQLGAFNNTNLLTGSMDEVRIWSTALSQSEIRDWMLKKVTSSHPQYCNLLTYYRMDEGSGSLGDWANTNTATLGAGTPSFTTSDVPLGDETEFSFSVNTATTLSLASSFGGTFDVNVTAGSGGSIFIYRVDEQPNITTPPGGLDQLSQVNYWGVRSLDGTGVVYTVVLNYDGHTGIDDENNLRLVTRADNAAASWADAGATLDVGANTLTLTGQTGTEFILGSTMTNPLPIELLYFRAETKENSVNLSWATASEVNNDFFTLERSRDALTWETIATIKGAGNSDLELSYETTDNQPLFGTSFYRLKQTDFNGDFEYFDPIPVTVGGKEAFAIYPNPATDELNILFKRDVSRFSASLKNLIGQEQPVEHQFSSNGLRLLTNKLAEGVYLLEIMADGIVFRQKVLVER
ncbi:MAG: LamG-like jellyroll fold domain-containing protein [Bacteroidota bacterium]